MSSAPLSDGLTLDEVAIVDLRNVAHARLEPATGLNVITGNNGQGKTSILEAIYLLATSRSFRTSRLSELVRHEQDVGSVRGRFSERSEAGSLTREQSVGLQRGRRTVRLDGQPPTSLTHYATRSPVVVFDPRQMSLSTGPAVERRTLLDRVTLFTQPDIATHRARYGRALKERQRSLADRSPKLDGVHELDAYEALLAEHGAALTRARASAMIHLGAALQVAFARIAAADLSLQVAYAPGGSDDVEQAATRLREGRRLDARAKRTAFGPHRDDIALAVGGHAARVVASQGQHRAITLALKIAEQTCIAQARRVQPILLLDDVSSELDAERTAALYDHLATTASQIFLTTTRRDLILGSGPDLGGRRDFLVAGGKVSMRPSGP